MSKNKEPYRGSQRPGRAGPGVIHQRTLAAGGEKGDASEFPERLQDRPNQENNKLIIKNRDTTYIRKRGGKSNSPPPRRDKGIARKDVGGPGKSSR